MKKNEETRSERKRRAIMQAATDVFIANGYDNTSMEVIATKAGVSKQTVYKHFADKDRLFSDIVLATTGRADYVVGKVLAAFTNPRDMEKNLGRLALEFLTTLMEPEVLKLRRLVLANAYRMPEMGRSWYENGFTRVLAVLAECFEKLAKQGQLKVDDPMAAANHFAGLLLWIPINEAMFTGNYERRSAKELTTYAVQATKAFLRAYQTR